MTKMKQIGTCFSSSQTFNSFFNPFLPLKSHIKFALLIKKAKAVDVSNGPS